MIFHFSLSASRVKLSLSSQLRSTLSSSAIRFCFPCSVLYVCSGSLTFLPAASCMSIPSINLLRLPSTFLGYSTYSSNFFFPATSSFSSCLLAPVLPTHVHNELPSKSVYIHIVPSVITVRMSDDVVGLDWHRKARLLRRRRKQQRSAGGRVSSRRWLVATTSGRPLVVSQPPTATSAWWTRYTQLRTVRTHRNRLIQPRAA